MKEIVLNTKMKSEQNVDASKTAAAVGSGTAKVFATPMMIALMENAALKCLDQFLDEGETSVGTYISTTHIAATPMEMDVYAIAEIVGADGRKIDFNVTAYDKCGVIGEAKHSRVVVYGEKFENKANEKLKMI